MVFSGILFLFRFLPLFFLIYYMVPQRAKNTVLFLGSLLFYAWGEPVYVVWMLFSTVSDYCHGILIEKALVKQRQRKAKAFLISSLSINLLMLGFFKYFDAAAAAVNRILGTGILVSGLPLPVGISFYTFQTMSYTIDVYRREVPAQKNPITFGAFVTMFPQLVAGPIVQYKQIGERLEIRRFSREDMADGIRRFIVGLGKKVLLANQAGLLFEQIRSFERADMTVLAAWMGTVCFAFQIYFDFSGYSDMAAGLGKMLGFSFPENFNYPYMAKSVTDFWRRWHMTLSGWFREYVYIPLGGSRKGKAVTVRNLLIVWALTGIWHGAAWQFLLWGLWFFVFLTLEKLWIGNRLKKLPGILQHLYALSAVLGGWVLFSLSGLREAGFWAACMAGGNGADFGDRKILYVLTSNLVWLAAMAFGCTPLPAGAGKKAAEHSAWLETGFYLGTFALSIAFLLNAGYNPFLYFRF